MTGVFEPPATVTTTIDISELGALIELKEAAVEGAQLRLSEAQNAVAKATADVELWTARRDQLTDEIYRLSLLRTNSPAAALLQLDVTPRGTNP